MDDGIRENADEAKRRAGAHAARYVADGMKVGLGTGSTVRHTIVALGEASLDIVCTATSLETHRLAEEVGLRVVAPDELRSLDIAIDGADEVDSSLNLTKGGGGALTREKVIAQMAERFVVVVDESKLVDVLGPFGTPLEVLPFAPGVVSDQVRALGASEVAIREDTSDNGNLLVDARFGTIPDPDALSAALNSVPGLVEHGIFLSEMVAEVVVAGGTDVYELRSGA